MKHQNTNRIPSLDGLRALSIFLVLMGHSYHTADKSSSVLKTFILFFGNAHLGVLTFFVISGYLITFLLRKEWDKKGRIDLGEFYKRRILRIFPAFYSYLLVVLILMVSGKIVTSSSYFLSAATFTVNYQRMWDSSDMGSGSWFVKHFWTLSLEEQFYLFWPVTVLLVSPRRAKNVALAIIVLSPIIRIVSYFVWPESREFLGRMLHTAADSIMVGCIVALWEGEAKFEFWVDKLRSGLIPMLAIAWAFILAPLLGRKFYYAFDYTIGYTTQAVAIVIVMLWVTRWPHTVFGRLLNSPALVFVGVLSYSLYLWQQLFLTPLNATWTGKYPLNLVCSFAMALASYYLIEKPFLRFKERIIKNKRQIQTPGI